MDAPKLSWPPLLSVFRKLDLDQATGLHYFLLVVMIFIISIGNKPVQFQFRSNDTSTGSVWLGMLDPSASDLSPEYLVVGSSPHRLVN